MSRGVVLWPGREMTQAVRGMWDDMAELGLPSMATHSHRLHEPHVSLVVAEIFDATRALEEIAAVPSEPISLSVSAAGVFPGGVLFLVCEPNQELLEEQQRIHRAVLPLATDAWSYFEPGRWTPHITLAMDLTTEQLVAALPVVLDRLPLVGRLERGGIEDGSTAERWPAPAPRPDRQS